MPPNPALSAFHVDSYVRMISWSRQRHPYELDTQPSRRVSSSAAAQRLRVAGRNEPGSMTDEVGSAG